MTVADEQGVPVRAKAILVDPATMMVMWMNESPSTAQPGSPVDNVVPMAESLGVREALRSVADTGVARHLQADLVSTSKGAMAMVVSIYRLPDGMVLVLIENTWQIGRPDPSASTSRRFGRPAR